MGITSDFMRVKLIARFGQRLVAWLLSALMESGYEQQGNVVG
jgi:hypothetical protein